MLNEKIYQILKKHWNGKIIKTNLKTFI